MKTFPEVINFRITSKCGNDCKYCYASKKNSKELPFSELQRLFRLVHKKGTKAIVLCGGEPLLKKDFEKIIKELKKYNFKIFLDTTGDLFFQHRDLISKEIDILGLPIDFPDKSYRNKNNLNNVIKILNFFKGKSKRPFIKIGTVITKDNINLINKIGDLIKDYSIDMWKIYEFIPIKNTNASKNKLKIEIPSKIFKEISQKIKQKFSQYFKIVISERKDRSNAYFLVEPNGMVFTPKDDLNTCEDIIIGNIFDKDIVEKWEKIVSKKNYKNNAKVTFGSKLKFSN